MPLKAKTNISNSIAIPRSVASHLDQENRPISGKMPSVPHKMTVAAPRRLSRSAPGSPTRSGLSVLSVAQSVKSELKLIPSTVEAMSVCLPALSSTLTLSIEDLEIEGMEPTPMACAIPVATRSLKTKSPPRALDDLATLTMPRTAGLSKSSVTAAVPVAATPSSSRTIFFDELWAEKQGRAFTRWVNFVFQHDNDLGSSMVLRNKTSDSERGTAAWSTRLADANTRHAAHALYRSDAVTAVTAKIEQAVETGRLALRTERAFHADLGMKHDTMKKYFLSFDARWLKLVRQNSSFSASRVRTYM